MCWGEGSSTAQVRGGESVSWKPLAASLSLQELKARDDVLSLFLLDFWGHNAAFLVSTLLWKWMMDVRMGVCVCLGLWIL